MILACQNISKSFGEKQVLKNINFNLEAKEKCAIVGINGAGKTTLLKIILGTYEPDSGKVVIARDIRIGYLSQHQDISFDCTVIEAMRESKKYIIDIQEKIHTLEFLMKDAHGTELDSILESYNRLTTKYNQENGYAYESEINGVLKGLGFSSDDYDRHINTLSGGQKMRIALGQILLQHPDLVILDEPTNHLDMASIDWLENFLISYQSAVIAVSHDRYFIDNISTKIIEIDNGSSEVYEGSYSFYSEERSKIRAAKLKAYIKQQDEIKHEEAVITKLKQFNREKSIRRAESREKKLDKIEIVERPKEICAEMRLKLTPSVESGEDVLKAENISKAFGSNTLFSNISIDIKRGEHVALIGGNGTGKTTILKILNHMIAMDSGSISLGSRVQIGYFDQEHQNLNPENSIFDEISDSFPDMSNTKIRNVLAAFLFTGDDVFKKIYDLSGGEKGRLSLAKLMLSPANFLILDEPTNHLDIQSKEILEDAIKNYEGTILAVSHDRYFINRTATKIIELRNKVLTVYKGNYDYYEENKDELYNLQNSNNKNADTNQTVTKSGFSIVSTASYAAENNKSHKDAYIKSKQSYSELRKKENEIKRLEKNIDIKESRISDIDSEMLKPENSTNVELLISLNSEKEILNNELVNLYKDWESANE